MSTENVQQLSKSKKRKGGDRAMSLHICCKIAR